VELVLPANTIQVQFVGIRGGQDVGQPFGDIAIDDITFICSGSECLDDNFCNNYVFTLQQFVTASATVKQIHFKLLYNFV
jgi:hypothetical protein